VTSVETLAEKLARIRAEKASRTPRAIPVPIPATAAPSPTFEFHPDLIPTLDDETPPEVIEERTELDTILGSVDILEAYRLWCGKMTPDPKGRTEGIKISCPNPAHPDKDPSAWINTDKGTYFCGGCQEGGDKYTIASMKFDISQEGDDFVTLKRRMAEDLGWSSIRTLGGSTVLVKAEEEDSQNVPSEDPVRPAVASIGSTSSLSDSSPSSSGLALVTPLPAAQDAEDAEREDILINAPAINWRDLIPEGTFLYEFMAEASKDDLPEEYYFWLGMQALGAAAGRDVRLGDVPEIIGNLFVCLLGPSGIGKSRSSNVLLNVLREALPYDYKDENSKGTKVITGVNSSEALIDSFARPVPDPINPKVIAYHAPVRGLVNFPELALLVGKSNRVGNPMKPTLMEFFDGNPTVEVQSRGSGHVKAVEPFALGLTTTQPRAMRELLTQSDVDSGFLNRWIFAVGPVKPPIPIKFDLLDMSVPIDMLKHIRTWCARGRVLPWSEDAHAIYARWYTRVLHPMKLADEDSLITRADLLIKKCALLFAINEGLDEITTSVIERALELYEYLVTSYAMVSGQVGLGQFEDIHQAIIGAMSNYQEKRGKDAKLTTRDISRSIARRKYPIDLIIKVIEAMLKLGELEEHVVKTPQKVVSKYRYIS
jgi:hypothetical protein